MASEDCDALGISPSNNQIQKTGAGVACQDNESLPASDLERWEVRVRQEDAKQYPFPAASLRAWAVAYRLLDADA